METEKLYQNEEWLYNKYINEIFSKNKIGKLCGVDHSSISYYLKKYNILERSLSESVHLARTNHCNLSQKAIEFLNGELLGDGCLATTSRKNDLPSENLSARFIYTSKYLEYIKYISDTLKSFGIEKSGNIRKYYNKIQDTYVYKYNSHAYKELALIYKKWYPNGKKIIPKDIKLSKLTLRQHFIGDGSLIHQKGKNSHIVLCTCGFTIFDVNWLIEKLIELGFKATRQISRNIIYISKDSTKKFLNYIGKCPVNCYNYKWALERR